MKKRQSLFFSIFRLCITVKAGSEDQLVVNLDSTFASNDTNQ